MSGVRQDGAGTDVRIRAPGRIARVATMRTRTRIVLATLLFADIWLLIVTGLLLALYMERPAGLLFAGCCWALAALLAGAARMLGRNPPRRRR
jgi:hypothetical protein